MCVYNIELFHTYCHNPGQIKAELSNLDRYYYRKITTTTTTPHYHHHKPDSLNYIELSNTYYHNLGKLRVKLSYLEWYYYLKITTTTPHPPHYVCLLELPSLMNKSDKVTLKSLSEA